MSTFKVRAGQREFERGVERHRVAGLLARRQFGKTTIAARIALKKMMKLPGHTVVFGSVKLDLGREIVRKEADAMQRAFGFLTTEAQRNKELLKISDGQKEINDTLTADDFADLYEHSRLEFRLYHSKSVYSRTKVVALTPAAVGETGDLILDEVGRVKNFRDVVEAVMPIIASNPEFRCIYTTTPPPDDTHYSFELLAPPVGVDLPVNPKGNWYQSELGVWVLRITAEDAYADGVPLYDDDSGEALSPAESRAKSHDKDAWDRNYGCKFVLGGTAACNLLALDTAQRRGAEVAEGGGHLPSCQFFQVDGDEDLNEVCDYLRAVLGPGRIGLGWDLATTTKATSNPSALSVCEEYGVEEIVRAIVVWKTADPDVALGRVRLILEAIRERASGGRARRMCLDATNERYFAQAVKKELMGEVPCELVVGSETVDVPGQPAPITKKQWLGSQLVAELEDNHLWLPAARYVREDWRLVKKERGLFVCEPDASGRHGDTFDSTKLGLKALRSSGGAIVTTDGIRMGGVSRGGEVIRVPIGVRLVRR